MKLRLKIGNIILAPFIYLLYLSMRGVRWYEIVGWVGAGIGIGLLIGAKVF